MKLSPRTTIIAAAAFLALSACAEQEFTGTARKAAGEPKKNEPKTEPTPESQPQTPGKPGKPTTTVTENDPVEASQDANPNTPDPGTDQQNQNPGPGVDLASIIGGLIHVLTDVAVNQPDANDVEFGGDKVFHIGDGNFDPGSECASGVRMHGLKGTSYFFEFEVTQDNTHVDIEIKEICGVDYNESNSVILKGTAGDVQKNPLPKASKNAALTGNGLAKGKYSIVVESRDAGSENASDPGDNDDFIVGKVHVKADKPIKPGKVGAL